MNCDRCDCLIEKGEETEHLGQLLCENCYMDALSPAQTCNPWAVYAAKSMADEGFTLTKLQENILQILRETNGVAPEVLSEKLDLKLSDLQREIATLRHMEKIRAAMKDGKKVIRLW